MNDRPESACPPAPGRQQGSSIVQCLHVFKHLLQQTQMKLEIEKAGLCFYDRLFTPSVTLWCMIFQRLNHDHTLQAAVCDLHAGGADRLASKKGRPPSELIRSLATAAFSKARKRSPLALFSAVLRAQAKTVWSEFQDGRWHGLRVLLLDGSQISLRPHPGISSQLASCSNQNGQGYWVLMRVVATFCLHTGAAVASAADSTSVSEQALARRPILKDMAEKEWLAGLMAYNLVRVVMAAAATAKGLKPSRLSFSAARRFLVRWLLTASSKTNLATLWRKLLKSVARTRLPSRKKTRPPEPRVKRHKRETFPPLRGSRSVAREIIRINNMKS